jgi:hypothetical protein
VPPRLAALLLVVLATLAVVGCGGASSLQTGGSRTGTVSSVVPVPGPAGAAAQSCKTFAADAEALRATAVACDRARQVVYGWQRDGSCALPRGASRGGCLTGSYRCQAVRTDRGTAVSCARAEESISFVVRRG